MVKTLLEPTCKRLKHKKRSGVQFHWIQRSKTVVRITFIARTRRCRANHSGCSTIFDNGYKMHPAINHQIKSGVIENYEIGSDSSEKIRAMGFRGLLSSRSKSTGGAFKGQYKSESLWGGDARLGNPDALFYAESHGQPSLNTKYNLRVNLAEILLQCPQREFRPV